MKKLLEEELQYVRLEYQEIDHYSDYYEGLIVGLKLAIRILERKGVVS